MFLKGFQSKKTAETGEQSPEFLDRSGGKNMINIDMWYGDKPEEVTGINWSFSDTDCVYHGNLYKDEKTIGDYEADTMQEVQEAFPQLAEDIDKALN